MNTVSFQPNPQSVRSLALLAVVSAVILGAGMVSAPDRAWSSLLIAVYIALTVALGGLVLVALEYITGAGWSVAFRRIPEALATILPIVGVALLGVIALRTDIYEWRPAHGADAGTFWFKELWLSPKFLLGRGALYVVLWTVAAFAMISTSRSQDISKSAALSKRNRRLAAITLLIFAPTFSLAVCDWLMSLEPMWFSTIWGVYHFSGLMVSTLSVVVLLAIHLRRAGPLRGLFTDAHLHDLGRLLFGFSCFWMYMWFSQYMLIWYSNIPEETGYFVTRTRGAWGPLMLANIVINWLVPFLVLLPRPAKRSRVVMARIAVLLLIGRWLDLYLMVYPSTLGGTPIWGIWETASVTLLFSTGCLLMLRALTRASLIPVGDPYLSESLHSAT